eukprot:gene10052-11123_t
MYYVQSATKLGGIYLAPCNKSSLLFPLEEDPLSWLSCHDAYEYTWSVDPDGLLAGLSADLKIRLARSSGFCPHHRCQLSEVGNADREGRCPQGLCYSKVEHGAVSFGACCFRNGTFETQRLLGYYDKLSPTPKPIYRAHRVLLQPANGTDDPSPEVFFNAHYLRDHLIASQCPLHSTVEDFKLMLVQQQVRRWLQIYNPPKPSAQPKPKPKPSPCLLLPEALRENDHRHGVWVEEVEEAGDGAAVLHYRISFCFRNDPVSAVRQLLPFSTATTCHRGGGAVHGLEYFVFRGWEDFLVPNESDAPALLRLAQSFAGANAEGQMVGVNCLSGRGRSGSFAALVAASIDNVTTHRDLIDLIVAMRERRDGLVETPRQYRFIATLLGLPDPAQPSSPSSASPAAMLSSNTESSMGMSDAQRSLGGGTLIYGLKSATIAYNSYQCYCYDVM